MILKLLRCFFYSFSQPFIFLSEIANPDFYEKKEKSNIAIRSVELSTRTQAHTKQYAALFLFDSPECHPFLHLSSHW